MCCQGILHETAKTFLAEQCKVDENGNKLNQVISYANGNPLHRFFLKDGTFVDEFVQQPIGQEAAMIALKDSLGNILLNYQWPLKSY